MKRTLFLFLTATALTACAQHSLPSLPAAEDSKSAVLTVNIAGMPESKANSTVWTDDQVSTATVFVFNSDGSYDNQATATGPSVSVRCTQGVNKQVYVVANKSIGTSVTSIADLHGISTSLTDFTPSHFTMTGYKTGVEAKATGNAPIEIDVVRYASKITLDKITHSLTETGWKDMDFYVKGIYLINAPGGDWNLFEENYTPSVWYNQCAWSSSVADDWLYESLNQRIIKNGSYPLRHTFYCLPNPTTSDSHGGTWSPRKTRLVIEALIGTRTFYYPITLGSLARNTHYAISNLNITRLGSSDPDYPVSEAQMTFTLNVKDWTVSDMGTQTI